MTNGRRSTKHKRTNDGLFGHDNLLSYYRYLYAHSCNYDKGEQMRIRDVLEILEKKHGT